MALQEFLEAVGHLVEDFEEETFLLFSQDIPSGNLGFIDSRSNAVDVVVHGQDISVRQSPSVLTSTRAGGTTGAVLWKITPLIAEWISSKETNPLWTSSILNPTSTIVELGCGISGLIPICLAPSIHHYIATDQEYVQRLLADNISSNAGVTTPTRQHQNQHQQHSSRSRQSRKAAAEAAQQDRPSSFSRTRKPNKATQPDKNKNITFVPLDWELDDPSTLQELIPNQTSPPPDNSNTNEEEEEEGEDKGFSLLLACDCIYNNALITPFIRTCADICRLRPAYQNKNQGTTNNSSGQRSKPTICVIAQQLRSPEVFEPWLREAMGEFHVWRVRDEVLGEGLRGGNGYAVHVLVLKEKGRGRS